MRFISYVKYCKMFSMPLFSMNSWSLFKCYEAYTEHQAQMVDDMLEVNAIC